MATPFASELLQRAEVISKNHEPLPDIKDLGLTTPVKMIFCCFDRRVIPEDFLGLKYEDRVLLVRTASGTPARNIMDIVAIDRLVGISELVIVKHTDCGALHLTEEAIREHMVKHNPDLAGKVNDVTVGATTDIVERTRQDVDIIKSSPFLRKELRDNVSGLLFDIKTGKVDRIV